MLASAEEVRVIDVRPKTEFGICQGQTFLFKLWSLAQNLTSLIVVPYKYSWYAGWEMTLRLRRTPCEKWLMGML